MKEFDDLLKTLEQEADKSFSDADKQRIRADTLAYVAIKLRTAITKSKQEVK